MGFGKMSDEPKKKKKHKPPEDKQKRSGDGFKPSTTKELKEYARRAAEHDEAKKNRRSLGAQRDALDRHDPIPGFKRKRFIAKYAELIRKKREEYLANKKNDKRWAPEIPRYEMYNKHHPDAHYADSNFAYAVQTSLAQFSWKELSQLIAAGLDNPYVEKDFSTAFNHVQHMMYLALGLDVDEGGVRYVLADRDETLALWPAEPIDKRNSKMSKSEAAQVKKGKLKGRAAGDEDEEEEEDEVEEEEEEEDEEDEDEEDEAPRRKSKGKAAAKKGKTAKAKPEKATRERREVPDKIGDSTIIAPGKPRDRGGPKAALIALVPKKGIKFKDLKAKAKEEELPAGKIAGWVQLLCRNGFLVAK